MTAEAFKEMTINLCRSDNYRLNQDIPGSTIHYEYIHKIFPPEYNICMHFESCRCGSKASIQKCISCILNSRIMLRGNSLISFFSK